MPSHNAFEQNDTIITESSDILDMWAAHYEALGQPSICCDFDQEFYDHVNNNVQEIVVKCLEEQSDLDYPISFEEVKVACQSLPCSKKYEIWWC